MCVLYVTLHADIIADILLGEAPKYDGVVTTWFPEAMRGSAWFLSRPFLLLLLCTSTLLPLMSLRRMERLSSVNFIGIGSLVLLCLGLSVLAAVALSRGQAHVLPLAPDVQALGKTRADQLWGLANVLPVIITAAAVHQSVHPLRYARAPPCPQACAATAAPSC